MNACYIFLGPTMAKDEIQLLLPSCTILPPVGAGDLVHLRAQPGDTVVIIDGYFRQQGAVRHKEILALLDQGIRILGASSMGALRAAEFHPFGMEGVGEIFKLFVSGDLEGDDEVTLLHLEAEQGYAPVTEALVNIRWNLQLARKPGIIGEETERRLTAIAQSLPFTERTYATVFALARKQGIAEELLDAVRHFIANKGVDLKRLDALKLFSLLANKSKGPTEEASPNRIVKTLHFLDLQQEAKGQYASPQVFVADQEVLDLCRVVHPDYPSFHYTVALRTMIALYGKALSIMSPPDSALLTQFRSKQSLEFDTAYREWLQGHYLTEEELLVSMRDSMLTMRIISLVLGREHCNSATHLDDLEQLVSEYLVHLQILKSADKFPDQLAVWLSPLERETLHPKKAIATAAVRAFYNAQWAPRFIINLKCTGAFAIAFQRTYEVKFFNQTIVETCPDIVLELTPTEALLQWARLKWGAGQDLKWNLMDRGFRSEYQFTRTACVYQLYDEYHPVPFNVPLPIATLSGEPPLYTQEFNAQEDGIN